MDEALSRPGHASGDDELEQAVDVLKLEYGVLMSALGAAWSASLTRTSLFLGVLSAAGVGLGLAAQGGLGEGQTRVLSIVVLLLVLFLGVATFVRLVEVQRESMVYLVGMNRIRAFLADQSPLIRPRLVLPVHDDRAALYRSVGTGMRSRPPRFELAHLTVQTQGIVGIVTAVVAGACGGLVASGAGAGVAWTVGVCAGALTVVLLFGFWGRSLSQVRADYPPMLPGRGHK